MDNIADLDVRYGPVHFMGMVNRTGGPSHVVETATGTSEGWKKTFCGIAEILKPVYERDAHPPAGK